MNNNKGTMANHKSTDKKVSMTNTKQSQTLSQTISSLLVYKTTLSDVYQQPQWSGTLTSQISMNTS